MSVFQDIPHKTIKILPEKCKIWYNPIIRRYSDAKTGFLSKQTQSMLQRKLSEYPDELLILDIMDDFRKETKEC